MNHTSDPSPVTPTRTCVGCRRQAPVGELVRLVVVDSVVCVDEDRRLDGRGAHLHPGPDCLAVALRRRAICRALKADGSCQADSLAQHRLFT